MNVTHLSRAELASELLATPVRQVSPTQPCACDAAAAYKAFEHSPSELAHKLSIARELLLRDMRTKMLDGPIMASPQVVKDWLCMYCAGLEHEVFLVLYLNAQHVLIEAEEMFRGTLTQTSVYPREVVKSALAHNAASVLLAHNHPSGQLSPSSADELLTQTLKSSLMMVDVRVLDHFVVGGDRILSFAEQGLL
ncbi:JAB domain-containing protein [Aquabacterium soli]|uniref:JAB domain-containing protein n=1 Tax=Aquabacterium soli TaxID=2493092 RepID=UPI001F26E91A|nr:DNA repair protein RadC [Aquabacterium soli]